MAKRTAATAATKEVNTKAVGRFEQMIKRSGDGIIGDRADRVVKSAKMAQRAVVDKIEQEVIGIQDKLDNMLDHSPDNRYSLKVGQSFEGERWAGEFHSLSVQLVNKQIELEIASKNYKVLFEGEV